MFFFFAIVYFREGRCRETLVLCSFSLSIGSNITHCQNKTLVNKKKPWTSRPKVYGQFFGLSYFPLGTWEDLHLTQNP